ncbi:MAG: hypothetical protein LUH63_05385 [Parabacteroides sp.]|nr:hypothetical protein [Parabacteroides sp.]
MELNIPATNAETPAPLQPGVSHEITLNIYDTSLDISSVKVSEWTPVERGELVLK